MPKYPATSKSSGYRDRDAIDPRYQEAEQKVWDWLMAQGLQPVDFRPAITHYDFMLPSGRTIDVKCDGLASTTNHVAWETTTVYQGREYVGWGMQVGLTYAAITSPQSWKLYLIKAETVRSLIRAIESGVIQVHPDDAIKRQREGKDGRSGTFYTLSLDWLRRNGCIAQEVQL